MKATGIVRRVDSLGRVVIPKEIRHTLRIKEGSPLEIYTDKDGGVTFRKYSPLGDLQDFSGQICEAIHKNTGFIAAISDPDSIIAVSGAPRRELQERPNSPALEQLMEQRKSYRRQCDDKLLFPTDASNKYCLGAAVPILSQGDLVGGVMLLCEGDSPLPEESDLTLIRTIAEFLGRQMET